MATATFTGTGNWDDATGKWSGGGGTAGQPTAADAAVLAASSVCTLNIATAVCDSLTSSSSGQLAVDGSVDTKLIVDKGIAFSGSTSYLNLDMSAAPTKKCEIYWNNDNSATADANSTLAISGKFMLKGAQKTESTTTTDALVGGTTTSVHVADATGWRVADKVVFCTTQAYDATALTITSTSWSGGSLTCNVASTTGFVVGENVMFAGFNVAALNVNQVIATVGATSFTIVVADPGATSGTRTATKMPRTDAVTLSSVTFDSGTTGPATIAWTDGKGAGGAVAHDHDDNCLVSNFTRNLILGPATAGNVACVKLTTGANGNSALLNDVEFRSLGALPTFSFSGALYIFSTNSSIAGINRCAFWDWGRSSGSTGPAIYWDSAINVIPRSGNVFYSTKVSAPLHTMSGVLSSIGDETNMVVMRATIGPFTLAPGLKYITPKISGLTSTSSNSPGGFTVASFGDCLVSGGGVWSSYTVAGLTATGGGSVTFDGTWLGEGFSGSTYSGATNGGLCNPRGSTNVVFNSCPENVSSRFNQSSNAAATTRVKFLNRDNSSVNQDIYSPVVSITTPIWSRTDTAGEFYRATSGMKVATLGSATTFEQEFPISVKGGVAATILLYVKKNAAYNDAGYALPSATISGLGITPITASGTNVDDTWELLDLSYASGAAPANDGTLTLTLSAQSSTATGIAYFSGIPITPFVSRVRHYGYMFDETSPTRTADITKSASFATADAYTDFTFSWSATAGSSTTTIAADTTFQKLYDGHQAKAVQNVGSAVALTGAGVAGSPALFAAGDVTISTTKTLNGGGSLNIPSGKTLTADVPFAFTYTNGTYSKADSSANATFSGGTLNIGAAGTYTFTQAASMTVSATPTAPSNYVLSDSTFTGTLTFENTTAHVITVEVPTGTSTATSTPLTVTFIAPVITADISITGMSNTVGANNRLQIINTTAISAADWTANTAYATGDIVLRTSGIGSESTAGLYFRATTGGNSHATTEPTWNTTVGGTTTDGTVVWTTYTILYYDADPAATSLTDTYIDGEEFLAGETVEIRFAEEDPAVSFKTYSTSVVATADGFSALVNSTADSVYATYALSGAAYDTTYSPNYVASYLVLDTNTNFTGASSFAYYCYLLTTSEGMYRFWGGLTALDAGNVRNNVSVLDLFFDETAGFVRQTDDVRIFKSDGTRPALDPTTGGAGIEINWKVPVNVVTTGGSAVLPQDVLDIADAVWAKTLP